MYMTSFTTMDWLERAEAAEALALAEAQPAPKKRLTATGESKDQRREEDELISMFFGKLEATRMEEASWRFRESHSRRHSFHAADAEEDTQPPKKRLRQSRSFMVNEDCPNLSQEDRDAISDDLRRSFQALRNRLSAHDVPKLSVEKVQTPEIVKIFRKRSGRTNLLSFSVPPTQESSGNQGVRTA